MAEDASLLAKRLGQLRSQLDALWEQRTSPEDRNALLEQYDELDRQTMRLIAINVKADGEEYDAATGALAKANTGLRRTLDAESQLIEALNRVANALDLIAKVRPA